MLTFVVGVAVGIALTVGVVLAVMFAASAVDGLDGAP